MRPPSFWPGSICHLPPTRVDRLKQTAFPESETGPIPPSICSQADILVNGTAVPDARESTEVVFKRFFSKTKAPLSGAPAVRRMKAYSAQSGYVYQYFYEGHREYRASGDHGIEFVFSISPDRKTWVDAAVLVSELAVQAWQQEHGREFSPTERYAIAKIALFQAFDERAHPALLREEIRVRDADISGIVEALDL